MAATTISPIIEKFIDKCDPEDPEYQRDLIRPVEIKEDVKLMEQRKRVSIILKSKKFRKELDDVIRKQCSNLGLFDSSTSFISINHISEQLLLASIPRKTTSAIGIGVSTNGIIPINDLRYGLANVYGQNERQIRCQIAAVHRLIDMFSWCNGSTHYITARVSKGRDEFLIKPFGLFFHEVTASCLITIDQKGNVIDPGSTVLSADNSRWLFHSTIHTLRPDICCLVFLRTPSALCVSGSANGLLPISADSIMLGEIGSFLPDLDSIDIYSPNGVDKLQTEINQAFSQNKKILFIPNHGIFIGGITVEETWFLVQRVQAACEVQELLYKMDISELILPEKEVVSDLKNVWKEFSEASVIDSIHNQQSQEMYLQKYRVGLLEFEAMMRHLDNSGYRTGYLYQTVNVYKNCAFEDGETHVSKYPDVEIPPSSTSVVHGTAESAPGNAFEFRTLPQDSLSTSWFNSPNSYKLDATLINNPSPSDGIMQSNPSSPKHRLTRWVSVNPQDCSNVIPHHPVTPGAYVSITRPVYHTLPILQHQSIAKGVDPKELKAKQKKVKEKYYFDKNTAGPISTLLDGLSWEEARRAKEESLTKYLGKSVSYGDEPLFTAASKGIIQREHKHHAVVLESVYKPSNPFKDTDDDLIKYREEVNRKMHPEQYSDDEILPPDCELELISPKNVEMECSLLELPSIPQDYSLPQNTSIEHDESIPTISNNANDIGMTSDSDYPGGSSPVRTAPGITLHGTMTSEASAADFSHDDTEKEGKHGKEKKKKKSFKSLFGKKKKKEEKK